MTADSQLREQLRRLLSWEDAHVGFEKAVAGLPEELRGVQPSGSPHSAWQLLEHMRLTQRDILDFCTARNYEEPRWPDDYWPRSPEPPSTAAWNTAIGQFLDDRASLERLALNSEVDLLAAVPNGTGQTYLRELVLVADHNCYHVGQLVLIRRLLGIWS